MHLGENTNSEAVEGKESLPVAERVGKVFDEYMDKYQKDVSNYEEIKHDREALFKAYNFDSLDRIELIIEMEKEFGITISDEEVADIKSYASVVHCVEQIINN